MGARFKKKFRPVGGSWGKTVGCFYAIGAGRRISSAALLNRWDDIWSRHVESPGGDGAGWWLPVGTAITQQADSCGCPQANLIAVSPVRQFACQRNLARSSFWPARHGGGGWDGGCEGEQGPGGGQGRLQV